MSMAFDDREYLHDELLIQADEWSMELFASAELHQEMELRRTLGQLQRMKSMVTLTKKETIKVDAAIHMVTSILAQRSR
jgi:hypothetical protein